MRDHELDLIAALVEGRLDDETEARALIESKPEFRAEYEAQKIAFEALSPVGTARLSETEKAALHRDVWTELRSEKPVGGAKRSPWYYRWAPVAAGMFVIVGLVAVINQGVGFDSGEDAETAPLEAGAATTIADSGEESDLDEDGAAGEAAPQSDAIDETANDFARALTATQKQFFAEEAAKIRSGDLTGAQISTFEEEPQADELQACVDEAGLSDHEVVGASISPFVTGEGAESLPEDLAPFIAAVPEGTTVEDAPIAFVDIFTCELVHVDE